MPSTAEFIVEYVYTGDSGAAVAVRSASPRAPSTPATPPLTQVTASSPQLVVGPAGAAVTPPEFVMPLEDDEERLDAVHGETPMQYHTCDNIVGMREPVPGWEARNIIDELNLASTGEPCTFVKVEQDVACRAAMQEKIDSIKWNQTWEMVDLPHYHRAITLMWVYKLKRNEAGEVIMHKARLVARGFVR
jgi:hypothetical protein